MQGTIFALNLLVRPLRHHVTVKKYLRTSKIVKWDVSSFKNSETLFILGSGASIADYPNEYFDVISRHDSIGFNFWLLHEFVPTFYVVELLPNSKRSKALWHNLHLRAHDYRNVPVMFKHSRTMWKIRADIPNQLKIPYITTHLSIPGNSDVAFKKWLRIVDTLGFITRRNDGFVVFRQASLSWLLVFALQQGYRRIVLCGIDLNNPHYFYEINNKVKIVERLHVPPAEFTDTMHPTNNPEKCIGNIPIQSVIRHMVETVMDRRGIELYIGSKNSALHPMLPVYNWQ